MQYDYHSGEYQHSSSQENLPTLKIHMIDMASPSTPHLPPPHQKYKKLRAISSPTPSLKPLTPHPCNSPPYHQPTPTSSSIHPSAPLRTSFLHPKATPPSPPQAPLTKSTTTMTTPTLSPLPTPSSSRRTSTSSPIRSHSPSPARPAPAQRERRNRAALRDYYGLKTSNPLSAANPLGIVGEDGEIHGGEGIGGREGVAVGRGDGGGKWGDGEVKEGEMDGEGFDAEKYVQEVLGREGLEGVLRIEGALVGGGFFLVLLYLLIVAHYLSFVLLLFYLAVLFSSYTPHPLPPKTQPTNPASPHTLNRIGVQRPEPYSFLRLPHTPLLLLPLLTGAIANPQKSNPSTASAKPSSTTTTPNSSPPRTPSAKCG